jgi:hypothetical protein
MQNALKSFGIAFGFGVAAFAATALAQIKICQD